jgi:hypothetical protein
MEEEPISVEGLASHSLAESSAGSVQRGVREEDDSFSTPFSYLLKTEKRLEKGVEMNPLKRNPLQSREDAQRAVVDMFEPLVPASVAGGARVSLGTTATYYDFATTELEVFAC